MNRVILVSIALLGFVALAPRPASAGVARIGLSLGPRFIIGSTDRAFSVAISPADSTLQLDPIDKGAAILSATAGLFPAIPEWDSLDEVGSWSWRRFGFLLHAQLISLGGEDTKVGFNQSIEGGIGIAYAVGKGVAVAGTWEKVKNRFPRDYVREMKGKQLRSVDGEVLLSLDESNDTYFRDDLLDALSLKVVWFPTQE